jgi:hypothetical protein
MTSKDPQMLNCPDVYNEAGQKTARARNHSDEALAAFQKSWFRRAKRMERQEDQAAAQEAFDKGYIQVRFVPKPVL